MSVAAIVAIVALVVVAAGSLLDWVAVELPGIEALLAQLPNAPESLALKGIDFMQGKALIGLGVIGAIVLLLARAEGARRVAALVAVAVGAGAVALAGTDVAEIIRIPEVPIPPVPPGGLPQGQAPPEAQAILQQIGGGTLSVEVGIGLWLVLLGGLAALASGVAMALARTAVPSYPATPAHRLPEGAATREPSPETPPPPPPPPAPPKRTPGEGPPPAWTPT